MKKKPFTTTEVAEMLFVHPRTILEWIKLKKLKAYRTPGRHCRIPREELKSFCRKYKIPIVEVA